MRTFGGQVVSIVVAILVANPVVLSAQGRLTTSDNELIGDLGSVDINRVFRTLLVYCKQNSRSSEQAKHLQAIGFEAVTSYEDFENPVFFKLADPLRLVILEEIIGTDRETGKSVATSGCSILAAKAISRDTIEHMRTMYGIGPDFERTVLGFEQAGLENSAGWTITSNSRTDFGILGAQFVVDRRLFSILGIVEKIFVDQKR